MSTKDHLNFNEIDTHSIDSNFMKKKTLVLGETNLHSTDIKFTENLLNVYP